VSAFVSLWIFFCIEREYERAGIDAGQLKHGLHGWEARDEGQVAW